MNIKECALFHVTFYEILPRNNSDTVAELWPCGDLYGHDQKSLRGHRQIREAALTVCLNVTLMAYDIYANPGNS